MAGASPQTPPRGAKRTSPNIQGSHAALLIHAGHAELEKIPGSSTSRSGPKREGGPAPQADRDGPRPLVRVRAYPHTTRGIDDGDQHTVGQVYITGQATRCCGRRPALVSGPVVFVPLVVRIGQ